MDWTLYSPLFTLFLDIQDLNILNKYRSPWTLLVLTSEKDDIFNELKVIFETLFKDLKNIEEDLKKKQQKERMEWVKEERFVVVLKQLLLLSYCVYLYALLLENILKKEESRYSLLYDYLHHFDIHSIEQYE